MVHRTLVIQWIEDEPPLTQVSRGGEDRLLVRAQYRGRVVFLAQEGMLRRATIVHGRRGQRRVAWCVWCLLRGA